MLAWAKDQGLSKDVSIRVDQSQLSALRFALIFSRAMIRLESLTYTFRTSFPFSRNSTGVPAVAKPGLCWGHPGAARPHCCTCWQACAFPAPDEF
jgi:hypothetical protein